MYRKNIRNMVRLSDEEFELLGEKIVKNNAQKADKDMFINEYLLMVVNMAAKYSGNGVNSDELIQEGNLCVLLTTDKIMNGEITVPDNDKSLRSRLDDVMRGEIRKCMVEYVDAEYKTDGEFGAALAKANLIYDATNYLAEKMGKVASIEELSQFTRIPVEEIEGIIKFTGNKITIADR